MTKPEKPVPINEDSAENLFNQPASLKVPLLWLGLILLPIFIAMIGALMNASDDAPAPPTIIQQPKEQTTTPATLTGRRGISTQPSLQKSADNCPYSAYEGKALTDNIAEGFKRTGREVRFIKENGAPFRRDPRHEKRINIFVDPSSKIITRIACG